MQNIEQVYIVCRSCPKWIKNVIHIEYCDEQKFGCFQYNIAHKIKAAMEEIETDCLIMHDDFFFTETINDIPFYHQGLITDNIARRNKNERYTLTLINTRKYLMERDKSTFDFDPHFPVILNKQKLLSIFPDKWPVHGYNIRSLYFNMHNIPGKYLQDNKIKKASEFKEGMKFFSTTDTQVDKDMKVLFERLYPLKSKYEK